MAEERMHSGHGDEEPPPYAESDQLPPAGHPALPAAADEKAALRQHDNVSTESCPTGPSELPARRLTFTVLLRKPVVKEWSLTIVPDGPSPFPDVAFWQLRYSTRYRASLSRHAGSPQYDPIVREVAAIRFPKTKVSSSGPIIKFFPHEADVARKGIRHVSPTDRLMSCTGFLTTAFALDLPALGSSRVVWKVATETDAMQALKLEASQHLATNNASTIEKRSTPPPPAAAEAAESADSQAWSPFATLHLIEEVSGRILAWYSRSAPWSKLTGMLTILPISGGESSELVEGIVIACAAMVGMQDQMGLFTSLVASGFDNATARKGKGRMIE